MLPVNGLTYPWDVTSQPLDAGTTRATATQRGGLGAAARTGDGPVLSLTPLAGVSSLTDQVAAAVRAAVRSGDLVPGRLYSAYQLAELLGVSRSPVREALLRLAEAGMVTLERNRGFRVVLPGAREIAEVFHLRLLLEVPAVAHVASSPRAGLAEALYAELAAMRAAADAHDEARFMSHDRELHQLMLEAGGNRRLVATVNHLRDIARLLGASTVDRSRSLTDIADEHEPIVRALETGDADRVADLMRAHLEHTGRLLVAQALRESGGRGDPDALWAEVVQGGRPAHD